ncbi:polysaccharide deacetylase [Basidiobolus meristosporus CBS 931.73]|uniref:Polysaccharide deacetylase n=1 Tax=Basidiobolus meristosporus CBS 931.73 TaxID=1314790 RepID=A0A1Y1YPH8_9FUNG|nr:polysaccharide deacetylase [Basidiobolus meristosporus CBS 931.73]|eukprot:ORX99666.1 polysaccharide deacetylase [Basidiobolus meristosporus CBS 931.73]
MSALLFLLVIFLFFGLTIPLVAYFQPRLAVQLLSSRFPSVYFHFPTLFENSPPVVALTIDDAVSANTPKILNILNRYSAKATFFVIGSNVVEYRERQADGEEDLLRRILKGGHELGNHMWRDEPSINLSPGAFKSQLQAVDDIVEGAYQTSRRMKWFRPGSGWFNSDMLATLDSYGYRLALGDIYPHDPLITSSRMNSWYVLKRVHSGGIIILHDRNHTLQTLEAILPALQLRGYKVVTLSEMVAMHEAKKRST